VSQGRAVEHAASQQKRQAASRARVRRAKAQENYYRSQGQAVERVANTQREIGPAQVTHGRAQLRLNPAAFHRHREQQAARLAPVLKVLEQTSRGYHATAGATDELIKGHGLKGAYQGGKQGLLHLKGAKSFSDVLKDAGVKNKTIRGIAGFTGDVLLDPSTYVTGGTGSLAEHAALKAASKAEGKALAKGLTKEQAARFGARAAKRAKAPDVKGATVKVGGHEIPAVRRVTAHASPSRQGCCSQDGSGEDTAGG
jgi:hypothetical protein